jgi:pilus assembly protein Flp/PilA
MSKLIAVSKQFIAGEEGATMVEYALMVALIAAACITAVTTLSTGIQTRFNSVAGTISSS